MKKILIMLILAAMVLGMVACAPNGDPSGTGGTGDTTGANDQGGFLAGFGEGEITPNYSALLGGFGDKDRFHTGNRTYIYAHVLAVSDEAGNTALMIATDMLSMSETLVANIASWCESKYNIPAANILISASHSHETPSVDNKYVEYITPIIQNAIQDAMDDRAPAEMYINTVQTEAMNFVRHYWNAEGEMYAPNYGSKGSGLVSHETDADNDMQLLKFERGEEKKPIIVVNFQGHPHIGASGADKNISANWPGVMRDEVKKEIDCNIMYFSGAGGNVNSSSYIEEENVSKDYKDHGKRAAKYVIKAEDSYTKVETGTIKAKQVTNTYEADHSMDHLYDIASKVIEEYNKSLAAGMEAAKQYPELHSVYHANAIVKKYKAGPTRDMTIGAIAIGDVVFTIHPYELFDTNGMEIKGGTVGNENYATAEQQENPYKMTIVTTMSNGTNGYIPSALNCKNGSYAVDVTNFVHGTAETLVTEYLNILNELHG